MICRLLLDYERWWPVAMYHLERSRRLSEARYDLDTYIKEAARSYA